MKEITQVAIVGLGAVGAVYADCMEQNLTGGSLWGIVRRPQDAREPPVSVNGRPLAILCRAAQELTSPLDLILFAVKDYHLEQAAEQIAHLVTDQTILLSLLNGVRSEQLLSKRFAQATVIPAMISGMDSNRGGSCVCCSSKGVVCFGQSGDLPLQAVARTEEFFLRAGVPHRRVDDIERQMWWKLMVNVGVNQVSTVWKLTYGALRASPEALALMRSAQRELIAIARCKGIGLSESDIALWEQQLAGLSANGRSSMLQDYWNHRSLETDILGEYVCQLGRKYGIPTPSNDWLVNQLRLLDHSIYSNPALLK